ncbi:MAG: sigma-70 family RNA polymerase sigma factor [Myxococcota bacterium]
MYLAKNKKLLAGFKRGERPALEDVYLHYQPGLTSFLRKGFTFRSGKGQFYFKGVQDPSDLRAAVQEVFRRAFEAKALKSYNGINSFTNWILAIGRNMVINQFRNREIAFSHYISASDPRSHLTVMDDEVTEEFAGILYSRPSKQQDSLLEHSELKELIESFMEDLSKHDQQLLVLRFAEGCGQEETATKIGSTRMKVRTAETKLRNRLRAYLRHTGYIDHFTFDKKK